MSREHSNKDQGQGAQLGYMGASVSDAAVPALWQGAKRWEMRLQEGKDLGHRRGSLECILRTTGNQMSF